MTIFDRLFTSQVTEENKERRAAFDQELWRLGKAAGIGDPATAMVDVRNRVPSIPLPTSSDVQLLLAVIYKLADRIEKIEDRARSAGESPVD